MMRYELRDGLVRELPEEDGGAARTLAYRCVCVGVTTSPDNNEAGTLGEAEANAQEVAGCLQRALPGAEVKLLLGAAATKAAVLQALTEAPYPAPPTWLVLYLSAAGERTVLHLHDAELTDKELEQALEALPAHVQKATVLTDSEFACGAEAAPYAYMHASGRAFRSTSQEVSRSMLSSRQVMCLCNTGSTHATEGTAVGAFTAGLMDYLNETSTANASNNNITATPTPTFDESSVVATHTTLYAMDALSALSSRSLSPLLLSNALVRLEARLL